MKNIDTSIKIMGLHLDSRDDGRVLSEVWEWVENSRKVAYIFTPNPEQVVLAWRKKSFQSILQQASWLLPDGVGLVWASQLKSLIDGQPSLERSLPGRELAASLVKLASQHHKKILLIGGRGYTGRFPADSPITWLEGYQDITQPTREEEAEVVRVLTKTRPDIVMVAFGAPHQETWLVEHEELLTKAQVKIGMAVGGTFDVLLGKVGKPPRSLSSLGLEWLYRLIQEPWRWRRQTQLPIFVWLAFKQMWMPR